MTSRPLKYAAAFARVLAPASAYAALGNSSASWMSAGGAPQLAAMSAVLRIADSYSTDLRPCPANSHSESFPNGQGYRCVPDR